MLAEKKHLAKVFVTRDVYMACIQHALTTEKEEIMGLLIGEIDEKEAISHISACMVLYRTDKQPDRVEISPEQLCTAAEYAEELTQKLNKPMRVVGWYHSHPHITVWPSHVDVRTQLMYQTMDPLFVGLIFSVYQNEADAAGNYAQLTCFQAMQSGSECQRREVELNIEATDVHKYNFENILSLPRILSQEEGHCGQGDHSGDILTMLHNNAFHTIALVHIVSKIDLPLYEDLETRLKSVKQRIKELEQIKKTKLC